MVRVSIWYCDLEESWYHACPACWVGRFFFVVMVVAPLAVVFFGEWSWR